MTMLEQEKDLRTIYGEAKGRAKDKVLDSLEQHSIRFITHSPFVVVSTVSSDGRVDTSPRGGEPGFVQVSDRHTLIIPDSRGNNRIDSMTNIVETGRIGSLFLIPGVDETLRVNGSARISNDKSLLDQFADARNPPKTCIVMSIEEVFLHCAKALMRSRLWSADARIDRATLPTMGQMISDQTGTTANPETQAEMVKRYQQDL